VLDKLLNPATAAATSRGAATANPELLPFALGPGLQILLAEDNAVNQKLVVRLLENYGHTVVVAGNGQEALDLLAQQHFDAVLMDVQMPVVGGLEATAQIRARDNGDGRRVPIIAMTAHALKGDRERCLAAGMDAYLAKPIEARELLQTICDLCAPPTELLRRGDGS